MPVEGQQWWTIERRRKKMTCYLDACACSQFIWEIRVFIEGVKINLSKVGDRVRCPQCRREARVVWVSQDGKTVAIKCMGYHSQISLPPTKFRKNIQTKTKKGMVFIIEIGK